MSHHGRMHAQHGAAVRSAPPDTDAPAVRRPRNFHVRSRHSALSAGQQRTWQRLWPELGVDSNQPGLVRPLDLRSWFGATAPVVLEIGSGAGTSTVAMARTEPDIGVVAVEVYRRGLAQLLSVIDQDHMNNIRLIRGEAFDVLERLIARESLIGVRVFFPDPWPKARHHKRRLLQPATIAMIVDRLQPGGVLHAATDDLGYAEQIAEAGDAEPRLHRVAPDAALPVSVDRPTTKYEAKARDAGRVVTELIWERRTP